MAAMSAEPAATLTATPSNVKPAAAVASETATLATPTTAVVAEVATNTPEALVAEAILPTCDAPAPWLRLTEMVSPTLAPIWNAAEPKLPSSTWRPLKVVCCEIRVISARRCCTSASSAARSESELVALADCTASVRMRCMLLVTSFSADSVVCASEMPSLALLTAWFRPLIWVVKRVEMARPAASSFALLMRMPEDRRSIAVASLLCEAARFFWAFSELMLVLTLMTMGILRIELVCRQWPAQTIRRGFTIECIRLVYCFDSPYQNLSLVNANNRKVLNPGSW